MRLPRKRGSTSNMVRIFIPDNTSTAGAGLAGLTNASTNLVIAYLRAFDSTATTYTGANIETITTIGTYQAPSSSSKVRFKAVDATNFPGDYELHFHDSATAFGSADNSDHIIINTLETSTTALHIGPNQAMIPLIPLNFQDGAAFGMTTLIGNVPQTGDSFARIGATGSGLTNLAPSSTALSTAQWTNTRAGNLDFLTAAPPTGAAIATAVWQDTTAGDFSVLTSPGKIIFAQLGGAFSSTSSSVFSTASLANAPTGGSAPSAAAIATAVWQDATAGDFTVTGSIGKSLFTGGVVPGGVNGLLIAGTNAATTITGSLTTTFTGNLTGSVASVTAAVNVNLAQVLNVARALDAIADTSLTLNDVFHCAIAAAAGKESVSGLSYVIKTPSTGTTIRTFTLDASPPTSRS